MSTNTTPTYFRPIYIYDVNLLSLFDYGGDINCFATYSVLALPSHNRNVISDHDRIVVVISFISLCRMYDTEIFTFSHI